MKSPVMIKSFQNGLTVILDEAAAFDELLFHVTAKFKESEKFFGSARVAISFEGRRLSQEEEAAVLDVIQENSRLDIVCVIARDEETDQIFLKALNQFTDNGKDKDGQFYKGTLKSGQVLETDASIIVLGDVNPGASVVSTGNIVILGTLYGTAYAGAGGEEGHFVAALDMQPTRLRIASYSIPGTKVRQGRWFKAKAAAKIAFIKNNNISIEPITKELLNDIPL